MQPIEPTHINSVRIQAEKQGFKISKDFNIFQNTTIRKNIFAGFPRGKDIKTIVIHGTAGGHTLPWVEKSDGDRRRRYARGIGLFHYLIDRGSPHPEGRIIEVLPPPVWSYHSSVSKRDEESIGIELLIPDPNNNLPPTDKQLNSLVDLCIYLKTLYPTISEFVGHGRNKQRTSGGWKNCPGAFPWDKFQEKLQAALGSIPTARDERFDSVWLLK